MQLPLQITFRGMDPSPTIESRIREKAETLQRFHPRIMGCRVVIEDQHRHHQKGRLFHIRIDLTVVGKEIVISRDAGENHAHEDPYVTIRDAFDEVTRQLEDHARIRRRNTKTHEVPPHGKVVHVSSPEDYGFIRTPDGRDIYFHRDSVIEGGFDHLEVGDEVRFSLNEVDAESEAGPHASSVRLVGKHHLPPG
jgi:cold shock CspA family protein/ribosome-associated translation inhibitor RaiA